MKKHFAWMVLAIASFSLSSCQKDEDDGLCKPDVGGTEFYRIEAFGDVNTVPDKRQVRLLTRVSDQDGVGVPGLSIEDFVLKENCENKVDDVESKTQIDKQTVPVEVKTVLLLDISGSLEGQIDEMKTAVNTLIDNMVDEQEMAVYTFNSQVQLLQAFTQDKTVLKAAVNQIPETELDASTNLYNAVLTGADAWEDSYSVEKIAIGNMIVFTDGKHNSDLTPLSTAQAAVRDKAVFVAALQSPNLDEASLKQLAGSEANYALATDITKLQTVFTDIQSKVDREANSLYFLTYTSPLAVAGEQDLLLYLKNNKNGDDDAYVRKKFDTAGFK